MAGKRSLRYSSDADMPESMRRLLRAAEGKGPVLVQNGRGPGKTTLHDATMAAKAPRNKYGNQVTVVDGIRFDSKREARYYEELKIRQSVGEVSYWLRQVPVHLPGGTRYVVDFLVFFPAGREPEYVDVKGRETQTFKIKKREVEHHYPIRILLA